MADFGSEIGAAITALAVIGAIIVLVVLRGKIGEFFGNLTTFLQGTESVQSIFNIFGSFLILLPDVMVAGGALGGLATMELKYVIPSIVAVLGTGIWRFILWALAKSGRGQFMAGEASGGVGFTTLFGNPKAQEIPTVEVPVGVFRGGAQGERVATNLCEPQILPGIASSSALNIPLGQLVIASIATIYVLDMAITTQGKSVGPIVSVSLLPVLYYIGTLMYGCKYSIVGHLVTILVGIAVGGMTYGVLKGVYPEYLPVSSPVSPSLPPPNPNATCNASGGVGATEEEYTCDLYMNGQRVTSAVVPT